MQIKLLASLRNAHRQAEKHIKLQSLIAVCKLQVSGFHEALPEKNVWQGVLLTDSYVSICPKMCLSQNVVQGGRARKECVAEGLLTDSSLRTVSKRVFSETVRLFVRCDCYAHGSGTLRFFVYACDEILWGCCFCF